MSSSEESQPLIRHGKNGSKTKTSACCAFIFPLILAIGLIVLFYLVHIQVGTIGWPVVHSFPWWVYMSDLLLIFPLFYIPAGVLLAMVFDFDGLGATGLIIILWLFFVIELVKAGYLTWIWIFGSMTVNSTFVIEAIGTYVLTALFLFLAFVLPSFYNSGKKERQKYFALKCDDCKEKMKKSQNFDLRPSSVNRDVVIGMAVEDSQPNTQSTRRQKKNTTNKAAVAAPAFASQEELPRITLVRV